MEEPPEVKEPVVLRARPRSWAALVAAALALALMGLGVLSLVLGIVWALEVIAGGR